MTERCGQTDSERPKYPCSRETGHLGQCYSEAGKQEPRPSIWESLTTRDLFAMFALASLPQEPRTLIDTDDMAGDAYAIADAMLKRRKDQE